MNIVHLEEQRGGPTESNFVKSQIEPVERGQLLPKSREAHGRSARRERHTRCAGQSAIRIHQRVRSVAIKNGGLGPSTHATEFMRRAHRSAELAIERKSRLRESFVEDHATRCNGAHGKLERRIREQRLFVKRRLELPRAKIECSASNFGERIGQRDGLVPQKRIRIRLRIVRTVERKTKTKRVSLAGIELDARGEKTKSVGGAHEIDGWIALDRAVGELAEGVNFERESGRSGSEKVATRRCVDGGDKQRGNDRGRNHRDILDSNRRVAASLTLRYIRANTKNFK